MREIVVVCSRADGYEFACSGLVTLRGQARYVRTISSYVSKNVCRMYASVAGLGPSLGFGLRPVENSLGGVLISNLSQVCAQPRASDKGALPPYLSPSA